MWVSQSGDFAPYVVGQASNGAGTRLPWRSAEPDGL
jgi:hypothetical protein